MKAVLWTLAAAIVFAAAGASCVHTRLPAGYPVEAAHYVDIDGTRVHYLSFNRDAPGTPLLFLHGYASGSFEWTYLFDELGPGYRVIAPDLPGSGLSDKPLIEYTVDYFVEMVRKFADAVGLRRFVLVGHSMGGHIASVFATRFGERLERLILIAPYGLEGEAGALYTALSNAGILVDMTFQLHNRLVIALAVEMNIYHDPSRIPQGLIDYMAYATFETENGVAALASVTRHTIGKHPVDATLPLIQVPTRIIWGENDELLAFRYAERFHSLIGTSDLVPIPDCGHTPQVEQAAATAAAIVEFLTE